MLKSEPDWSALPAETPTNIRRLLRQCLRKERKQRLQAIGDARIALEDDVDDPPLAPGKHRSILPWAVAAVTTAAALILSIVGYRNATEDAPSKTFRSASGKGHVRPGQPSGCFDE